METKFTPGPWVVEGDLVAQELEPFGMDSLEVAFMAELGGLMDEEMRKSNANLIAASPDLYHALESFVNNSSCQANQPGECEIAEKALAKARGEK